MITRGAFIKAVLALPLVGIFVKKATDPVVPQVGDTVEIHGVLSDDGWVTTVTTARGTLSMEEMRALPPAWTNPDMLFRR